MLKPQLRGTECYVAWDGNRKGRLCRLSAPSPVQQDSMAFFDQLRRNHHLHRQPDIHWTTLCVTGPETAKSPPRLGGLFSCGCGGRIQLIRNRAAPRTLVLSATHSRNAMQIRPGPSLIASEDRGALDRRRCPPPGWLARRKRCSLRWCPTSQTKCLTSKSSFDKLRARLTAH